MMLYNVTREFSRSEVAPGCGLRMYLLDIKREGRRMLVRDMCIKKDIASCEKIVIKFQEECKKNRKEVEQKVENTKKRVKKLIT